MERSCCIPAFEGQHSQDAARHGKRKGHARTSAALSVSSNTASSGGTNSTSGSSSSSSSSRVSDGDGYDTSCVRCEGGRCAMAARVDAVETNVLRVFLRDDGGKGPERVIGTDVCGLKRDAGFREVVEYRDASEDQLLKGTVVKSREQRRGAVMHCRSRWLEDTEGIVCSCRGCRQCRLARASPRC